jgi:hypothetical protein
VMSALGPRHVFVHTYVINKDNDSKEINESGDIFIKT